VKDLLARIAGWAVERPAPVLAATVLVALVGAVVALRLTPEAGTDSLVDSGSDTFQATEDFKDEFGDDAVVVLVRGDLERLVLTEEINTLLTLEGCLAGNLPSGETVGDIASPAPCGELAESKPARVVYGPATFLNQAAVQASRLIQGQSEAAIAQAQAAARRAARRAKRDGLSTAQQREAALAAGQEVLTQFQQQVLQLATKYGQTGLPRLEDPQFVSSVVFDSREPGQPKARFSYLFPSPESALISVRLEPGLSDSERSDAIDLIRDAVDDPAFELRDASYVVSGVPVVTDGLADELSNEILILLAVALALMTITLALVFGPPLRLLPLAIALGAAAIVFGGLAAVGGSLTMASVAVLPVLIGLAVDYAIQLHARFVEAGGAGSSPPRAAVEAAAKGGPVIGLAALATSAGFLVLLLSPIPQVRGFGVLVVLGIAIAFGLALTAGLATLSYVSAEGSRRRLPRPRGSSRFAGVTAATRRAGERIRAGGRRALAATIAAPGITLAVAAVLAVGGWFAGTRTEVISDLRELVPAELPALREVDELQEATGVSGEVDVTVTADDLTQPEVVAWMADFKQRVLDRSGFDGSPTSCLDQDTQLCPSVSLPDLFTEAAGGDLSQERIQGVLDLLPAYFSQAVISRDPSSGELGNTAVIAFGIKVMPFDEQKRLIDSIRDEIDPPGTENDPPAGVNAEVVGLPVLAADANSALESNSYLLALAGLVAVALVLFAVYRSAERALVPLIPIVFATGWSSLVLFVAGIPLNPMSATLGALVIAIATEFSVLLSARFHEERVAGRSVGEALRTAYTRTGAAVAASGITAIAGFAALIATDIRMLRDFGLVTVLDLGVALVGVLLVLPAALVWAERITPATSSASRPVSPGVGTSLTRQARSLLPRLRR
jgi:hydrophobe/amphiphile efflux-3 (HAE3) family protein